MTDKQHIFVHQIFYDEASGKSLDPGFIPLDNTSNERPDWFEFWVIRRFLLGTPLQEGAWYGFLSPRFRLKTALDSRQVLGFLEHAAAHADAALFSPGWDQIAYFLNPFEQGEFWHPGLLDLSQQFFTSIEIKVDLRTLVTHSSSTVFGNFIVAKPAFWRQWLRIANAFFEFVESGLTSRSAGIGSTTSYGSVSWQTPMKTFIQERFASIMLAQGGFRVAAMDMSAHAPIFTRLFVDGIRTRRLLQACDLLKQQYTATQDRDYLQMYRKFRTLVPTSLAIPAP